MPKIYADEMPVITTPDERPIRTLIAVPAMNMIHFDFATDLFGLHWVGESKLGRTKCSVIHDARNELAARAIEGGYDRVLWIDSDMRFQPDMMERLAKDMDGGKHAADMDGCEHVADMDGVDATASTMSMTGNESEHQSGLDYVAALAFKRVAPTEPVVYEKLFELPDMPGMYGVHTYKTYPHDQLFRIAASGFGCVMTSVRLLKAVWDKFGPPFSYVANLGEDMSFCWKVQQLGIPMYCDSRVKVGHIGEYVFSEDTYLGQKVWE